MERTIDIPKIKYEKGQSFHAIVHGNLKPYKIYIDHVIESYYDDQTLIIYRFYGRTKQWWHEVMCYSSQLDLYIHMASKRK